MTPLARHFRLQVLYSINFEQSSAREAEYVIFTTGVFRCFDGVIEHGTRAMYLMLNPRSDPSLAPALLVEPQNLETNLSPRPLISMIARTCYRPSPTRNGTSKPQGQVASHQALANSRCNDSAEGTSSCNLQEFGNAPAGHSFPSSL